MSLGGKPFHGMLCGANSPPKRPQPCLQHLAVERHVRCTSGNMQRFVSTNGRTNPRCFGGPWRHGKHKLRPNKIFSGAKSPFPSRRSNGTDSALPIQVFMGCVRCMVRQEVAGMCQNMYVRTCQNVRTAQPFSLVAFALHIFAAFAMGEFPLTHQAISLLYRYFLCSLVAFALHVFAALGMGEFP